MTCDDDDELDPRVRRVVRTIRADEAPDAKAIASVMARVRSRPRPRRMRPRWIARTAAPLALAAGLAIAVVIGRHAPPRPVAAPHARIVRFTLDAPNVSRVAVVGDFNGWRAVSLRPDRVRGRWTVALPIPAGRYTYAFVLDGVRWVADPGAPIAPDADFGTTGSVLVVEGNGAGGAS